LSERVRKGDEAAKKRLVEANLRLVIKICRSYRVKDVPLMDLIQEGNMGLMHACDKFDIEKGVRFSTYAALWIRQAVNRFLETKRRAIHIPQKKEAMLRKINHAEHALHQILGRTPRVEEIAAEIEQPTEVVERVLRSSCNLISLENVISDEDGFTFDEVFEDSRQINPEDAFLRRSSGEQAQVFLNRHLDKREKSVILHRFYFIQSGRHTFKKIGEDMGISAEAVRQIELKALNKIRHSRDELADCVYA
jgi:RNA polymerase primary sigma factor